MAKSRSKKKVWDGDQQSKYVARLRAESVLDKKVPLGSTPPPHPESGPTAKEYYFRQPRGANWPLNPYWEA